MECAVDENIEASSEAEANEVIYCDDNCGEFSGDWYDSNYLASSNEEEDTKNGTEDEAWESNEESEGGYAEAEDSCGETEVKYIQVDQVDDIWEICFEKVSLEQLERIDFVDVEMAYMFFNEYARVKGFSLRKYQCGYDNHKNITWKSFVCSNHGLRERKYREMVGRKRSERPLTRCGCKATYRVNINPDNSRFIIGMFDDVHNHELVSKKDHGGMLRSHRKMTQTDIALMNHMLSIGISVPKIYASFAIQAGGFHLVGFRRKDMYNEIARQRRLQDGDAKASIRYLKELTCKDGQLFWSHQQDGDGKLEHLFWCDGISQYDYEIFGVVLAFDATYGRNKYKCHVVIFSGVNHHLQTVVFATAIVSNETEETYVWVLQQFLKAMNAKSPKCVITDGDLAMRNAIRRVFPQAHHRLCAWHLSRNASANVKNKEFTKGFNRCMLYDYEVDEFEMQWKALVRRCRVRKNQWVANAYEKKDMWATAHIRGLFFVGLRTTSRCEGLHSKMGMYVGSRDSLFDFLHHYHMCLDYMRNNEHEADFKSWFSKPVMKTQLRWLEKSGASVYSLEVFYKFQRILLKAGHVKVIGSHETSASVIHTIRPYGKRRSQKQGQWYVSYQREEMSFKCSCKGLESFGLPCEHIVVVLVHMDIEDLPDTLVLGRWRKDAKEGLLLGGNEGAGNSGAARNSRYLALLHSCMRMCNVASKSVLEFTKLREKVHKELKEMEANGNWSEIGPSNSEAGASVKNHGVARNKGCGIHVRDGRGKRKRIQKCTSCREVGHNSRRCPQRNDCDPTEWVAEDALEDSQ